MATQIITRTLCDYCQHDDDVETTDGVERVVVAIGGDEYELDGCAKHLKPLADLKASLDEVARKVPRRGRKPKSNGGVTSANADPNHAGNLCPECGQVLANRTSLASHVRQQHAKSLLELEGVALTHECPECGKRFGNASGLGAHKRVHAR